MVDSFKGRKSGERSLESQDSCRGIGNSLEELLFSFERPESIEVTQFEWKYRSAETELVNAHCLISDRVVCLDNCIEDQQIVI